MKYFAEGGWWLPDAEEHLQDWMLKVADRDNGRLLYQGAKYRLARGFCRDSHVAVDAGAHVGLWSWQMAADFGQVIAFEPVAAHRACWDRNMAGILGAGVHPYALGAATGVVSLTTRTANSSGDTGVDPGPARPDHSVELRTLDSFDLPVVDFLKIDCEGYELFVLQGAVETLIRCRPTVIVEQKPETGMEARYGIGATDAVAFLEALGARRRAAKQGDYVLSWE